MRERGREGEREREREGGGEKERESTVLQVEQLQEALLTITDNR
jgi:hypothetical protein